MIIDNLKEYDLKNMLILSQDQDFIPLYQLTDIKYDKGFSIIRRENGQSEVSITAELDEICNFSCYHINRTF